MRGRYNRAESHGTKPERPPLFWLMTDISLLFYAAAAVVTAVLFASLSYVVKRQRRHALAVKLAVAACLFGAIAVRGMWISLTAGDCIATPPRNIARSRVVFRSKERMAARIK